MECLYWKADFKIHRYGFVLKEISINFANKLIRTRLNLNQMNIRIMLALCSNKCLRDSVVRMLLFDQTIWGCGLDKPARLIVIWDKHRHRKNVTSHHSLSLL